MESGSESGFVMVSVSTLRAAGRVRVAVIEGFLLEARVWSFPLARAWRKAENPLQECQDGGAKRVGGIDLE